MAKSRLKGSPGTFTTTLHGLMSRAELADSPVGRAAQIRCPNTESKTLARLQLFVVVRSLVSHMKNFPFTNLASVSSGTGADRANLELELLVRKSGRRMLRLPV